MKIISKIHENKVLYNIFRYVLIIIGSLVYAVGFQFFMFPNSIISGGLVGVATIVNYFSRLPVGVLTIIMNLPLFIVAWKHFGMDFMITSFVGMSLS